MVNTFLAYHNLLRWVIFSSSCKICKLSHQPQVAKSPWICGIATMIPSFKKLSTLKYGEDSDENNLLSLIWKWGEGKRREKGCV